MATIVSHMPIVAGHFSLPSRQSENHTTTLSTVVSDPALLQSNSVEISPASQNNSLSQESDFDSWLSDWDDLTNTTLSLLIKPPSTHKLGSLPAETDMAERPSISYLSPSPSANPARISNRPDDDPTTLGQSMTDKPRSQSAQTPLEAIEVPPRDGLYSTPLSWERPKLGYRVGNSSPHTPLSPEEESRLLSIAMPTEPYQVGVPSSPGPKPKYTRNPRKRKSSDSSDSDLLLPACSGHPLPPKKAHNMTEKRYRTNLNEKITALRDSVPSLRAIAQDNSPDEDLKEDLQGLSPARKLNKATIFSKAIEYITHLEKGNKRLTKEIQAFETRIRAFEMLIIAQSAPNSAGRTTITGHRTS